MQDFRQVKVWQKAHALVLRIYPVTNSFPRDEVFGLRLSMRKVVMLIPAKIAEGCGRNNDADFHRALNTASGSSAELEYQLILARDLGYISTEVHDDLHEQLVEVRKMLNVFMQRLT